VGLPTFPGRREIHWHSLYKTNAPACELQQDLGTEAKKEMSVLANLKIRFEVNLFTPPHKKANFIPKTKSKKVKLSP
jgi:hypothetical protein